jgi:hypothetical protein
MGTRKQVEAALAQMASQKARAQKEQESAKAVEAKQAELARIRDYIRRADAGEIDWLK